jgi:predicted secreted protein
MGLALGSAVYFVIWWIMLFIILPFGAHSQMEAQEVAPGTEPGAPAQLRLGRTLVINTIVSVAIWVVANYVYIHYYLRS